MIFVLVARAMLWNTRSLLLRLSSLTVKLLNTLKTFSGPCCPAFPQIRQPAGQDFLYFFTAPDSTDVSVLMFWVLGMSMIRPNVKAVQSGEPVYHIQIGRADDRKSTRLNSSH